MYLWQIFRFLFVSAVQPNLVHAQVSVGHVAETYGTTGSRNLFHGYNVVGVTAPGAFVLRRDGYAQEAQRS